MLQWGTPLSLALANGATPPASALRMCSSASHISMGLGDKALTNKSFLSLRNGSTGPVPNQHWHGAHTIPFDVCLVPGPRTLRQEVLGHGSSTAGGKNLKFSCMLSPPFVVSESLASLRHDGRSPFRWSSGFFCVNPFHREMGQI